MRYYEKKIFKFTVDTVYGAGNDACCGAARYGSGSGKFACHGGSYWGKEHDWWKKTGCDYNVIT